MIGGGPGLDAGLAWMGMLNSFDGAKSEGVKRLHGQNFIYWVPTMCWQLLLSFFYDLLVFFCRQDEISFVLIITLRPTTF